MKQKRGGGPGGHLALRSNTHIRTTASSGGWSQARVLLRTESSISFIALFADTTVEENTQIQPKIPNAGHEGAYNQLGRNQQCLGQMNFVQEAWVQTWMDGYWMPAVKAGWGFKPYLRHCVAHPSLYAAGTLPSQLENGSDSCGKFIEIHWHHQVQWWQLTSSYWTKTRLLITFCSGLV